MPKISIYDTSKKEVGTLELSDEIFAIPYNEALIHEVVVAYLSNQRQGTKSALTRSEVRGHAKKPWRQKGTGRARHGSSKGPQWTGGGIVFAVKPRDFSKKVNKKAKVVAFLSAFSQKLLEGNVIVLDNWNLEEAKTKSMKKILDAFEITGRNAIVLNDADEKVVRASRNIEGINILDVELLNTYDVVSNKKLIMTEATIKQLEEAFK